MVWSGTESRVPAPGATLAIGILGGSASIGGDSNSNVIGTLQYQYTNPFLAALPSGRLACVTIPIALEQVW